MSPSAGRRRATRERDRAACASTAGARLIAGMIPDAYLDGMKVEDSAALWERVLDAAPSADAASSSRTMTTALSASPPATCCREAEARLRRRVDRDLPAAATRSARASDGDLVGVGGGRGAARSGQPASSSGCIAAQQGRAGVLRAARRGTAGRAAVPMGRHGSAWRRATDGATSTHWSPAGQVAGAIARVSIAFASDEAHSGENGMTIKVAINGYGRIGRNMLRAHYEGGKKHDLADRRDQRSRAMPRPTRT